jgi:hypothetical protein
MLVLDKQHVLLFNPRDHMKKLLLLVSTLIMIFFPGLAGTPELSNQQSTAVVYFYRLPSYVGSANRITINLNNLPIVRLKNGHFFRYEIQPGDYTFSIAFGSTSSMRINAEAGKEYFVGCYINMGFWSGIPIMELNEPAYGRSMIDGNKLLQQAPEPISLNPKSSRIGIFMGGGFGFEKQPWFIDTKGNEITLSTGGGYSIGAEYAYRFSRNFELSFAAAFEGSTLSKELSNADGSYNRMAATLTPALIIPIKGGSILNLRLGAGLGHYSSGTMKIDGSQIVPGQKFSLHYNNATGFHGLFAFNAKFAERASMEFGLKYVNVKYKFKSMDPMGTVTDPDLLDPDGSGIFFYLGYYFHF